ncbi:F-box protein [Aspergillus candidus]|uniref:F-box domain-containing protein n=1 Tax=Aspergillus candidus TaxID=41067 RepID=A0A2I2FK86_ASPCN|nr:hypothetical protein BDW47DRAFT_100426 [Aspergillus candidus]PLB41055.1 hypothetical protein BDW47DRAFT_100426 [Aspergillus candidus]
MSTTLPLPALKTTSRVSTLPTEVLIEIFSHLENPDEPQRSLCSTWLPLMQVCQTWRTVAERLIFSKLTYRNERHDHRLTRQLLRHMHSKPYLWRYPQSLHMSTYTEEGNNLCVEMARKAAEHKSPVRKAKFESMAFPCNIPLLESLSKFPLVELDLCTVQQGLPIRFIFELFDLLTLKTLRLRHIAWSEYVNDKLIEIRPWSAAEGIKCPKVAWLRPQNQPRSPRELEQLLPFTRRRTGNITSLTLAVPIADPDVAELLFQWPRCLREVVFSHVLDSPYTDIYTASTIESLLAVHRQSLEKLDIPALPFNGLPDMSTFPALNSLRIHISSLLPLTPQEAWRHLAAPNLHHLTIDFTATVFEPSTSTWIKKFFHGANLPRPLHLTMEYTWASWHGPSPTFFPPDLQEETPPIASDHNIALIYRTPAEECILSRPPTPDWKASISPTARMICGCIPHFRAVPEGVPFEWIANDLGIAVAEVALAGPQLFSTKLVYSVGDRDMWSY